MPPITKKFPSAAVDTLFLRLRDSVQTASRVLFVVVLFYFFDNIDLPPLSSDIFLKKGILIAQFVVLTIAKIILAAGGLGNIARMAVGEEYLLTSQCFWTQARRYWALALFCAFIPRFIHFLYYLATNQQVSFDAIATALNIPLLVLFGLFLNPFSDRPPYSRWKVLKIQDLFLIALIYILINSCAYAGHVYLSDYFIASSLLDFGIKIAELVVFIFFIKSIYPRSPVSDDETGPQLVLINPPFSGIVQALSSLLIGLYPPAFVVLKALTPGKYKIREYSRVLWRDHYYQGNALVGITCLTANFAEAYKIAKEFRKRGSKVVMGGPHVSIFPAEALEFCDSVVIGPAESVWPDLVRDYEQGELKKIYRSSPLEKDMAQVRSYLAEQSPLVLVDFLETHRGCKFKCYFCANPTLQKGLNACSTDIKQMLIYLQKVAARHKAINFIDTNIYADPDYMKKLLRAMVPFKFKWSASASIDIATDDQALELLKASGCSGLLIGYEIPADSKEAARGGKLALADKYIDLTRKLKRAGIQVKGHFIYGFGNDNFASLCRLWLFCFKLLPNITVLSFLTPIPGSAFFEDMVKENKLRDLNWRSYNLHTLVYANPPLDNVIFRKAFASVFLLFLFTTSRAGLFFVFLGGALFCIMGYFSI